MKGRGAHASGGVAMPAAACFTIRTAKAMRGGSWKEGAPAA